MAAFEMVNVAGVGMVPRQFGTSFDGVNLDYKTGWGRYHHEAGLDLKCEHDALFDDSFDFALARVGDRYEVNILLGSEMSIPLFARGRVTFIYDERARHWTVSAARRPIIGSEAEWKLCSPDSLVNDMVAGLRCFASSAEAKEQGLGEAVAAIATSIESDKAYIVSRAAIYPRADCDVSPDTDTVTIPEDMPIYMD